MTELTELFSVPPLDQGLRAPLRQALDGKAKPVGALGRIEDLALTLGLIQQTLRPTVTQPVLLTTGAIADPHSAGLPIDFFGAAADATAAALPNARHVTIEIPGHVPDPTLIAPVLTSFYLD